MVTDSEPRYWLRDSSGTVVASLYAKSDGTIALQEGTSGNNNEIELGTAGELRLEEAGVDPNVDGELTMNTGDVKVQSGGSVVNLSDVEGVTVEDDGTVVVSGASAINAGSNLSATNDGDGTVTLDASGSGGGTTATTSLGEKWQYIGNALSFTYGRGCAEGNINDTLYLIGGETFDSSNSFVGVVGDVIAYDPATDSFDTTGTAMPTPRTRMASAVHNGEIYCICGSTSADISTATTTVESYDPATDTWTTRASAPIAVNWARAEKLADGKIHLVGGKTSSTLGITDHYAYDPSTDSWSSSPTNLPTGRDGMTTGVVDGIWYVSAGRQGTGSGSVQNVTEGYNPGTDSWITGLAPMPNPRTDQHGTVFDDYIFTIGGAPNGTVYSDDLQVYDAKADRWYVIDSVGDDRTEAPQYAYSDNLWVIGANINDGTAKTSVEEYPVSGAYVGSGTISGDSGGGGGGGVTMSTIDDFEDGNTTIETTDWTGWSADAGTLSAASTTNLGGSFAGDHNIGAGGAANITATYSGTGYTGQRIAYKVRILDQIGGTNDGVSFRHSDETNNTQWSDIRFRHDGVLEYNDGSWKDTGATWSAGTTYTLELRNIDYSANTYDIWFDGSTVVSGAAFQPNGTADEMSGVTLVNDANNGSTAVTFQWDDFEVDTS